MRRADEGFTLVEMLVAVGLFGLLMSMVTVFIVRGVSSIRDASTANTVQAQQQNALIDISRQVRYIDNPVNTGVLPPAILEATPSTLVFFTLSGSGSVDRLPYKVMLCTTSRGVESFTWAPTLTSGGAILNLSPNLTVPACNDAGGVGANRRVLVTDESRNAPTMSFQYWRARTSADPAGPEDVEMVPNGSLTAAELALLTKVTVTLSDSALGTPLEQTIVLINDR